MPIITAPPTVKPLAIKVEPKTKSDELRLRIALTEFAAADPSFGFFVDTESGETILEGQSELHLEMKVHALMKDRVIPVVMGAPCIAYRETLRRPASSEFTSHRNQEFARVVLQVVPGVRGTGEIYSSAIADTSSCAKYAPSVEKGVRSVLANGMLLGYPMMDVAVSWTDGSADKHSTSAAAFEIAARGAMKEACSSAGIELLEPVMKVNVKSSVEYKSVIISDLHSRRASNIAHVTDSGSVTISADVPLALLFGYVSQLASCTHGSAQPTMQYDHYAVVPRNMSSGPGDYLSDIGKRA